MYKHQCISSFDLFQSVEEVTRRRLAEECREITYVSDKVIVEDSRDMKFVYFVSKGNCHVLRALDLVKRTERVTKNKDLNQIGTNTNSKIFLKDENHCRTSREKGNFSYHFAGTGARCKSNTVERLYSSSTTNSHKCNQRTSRPNSMNSSKYCYVDDRSRAHLKVDELRHGDSFGLHQLLRADDDLVDQRRFILVSAGCRLIRIPRTLVQGIVDPVFMMKLRRSLPSYPSDEELLLKFNSFDKWRCFRESVVDRCAEKRRRHFLTREEKGGYL